MIERDVSLFPIYGTPAEELESFIVQFYEKNIKPSEVYVPPLVNQLLLKEALSIKIHVPVRGSKRKLLDLATKNAENAISERFELLAKMRNGPFKQSKNSPMRLTFIHCHGSKSSITRTFKVRMPSRHSSSLKTVNRLRRNTGSSRSGRCKDPMTMNRCGKSCVVGIVGCYLKERAFQISS